MPPDSEETSVALNSRPDPCPSDPSRPVEMSLRAAAVPYRRTPKGVEFLLVRTRSRVAWTFPKGHIERGESPMEAARREGKEEAAVSGRIEATPFIRYLHPSVKPPGLPIEVCVESYLVEVESEGPRGSAERFTAWFTPEEASIKLAENQQAAYAREHRRVIKAALARLDADSEAHP
jgi:8-oxo-dGTP pyrophosphatase MutT (NUDIX family)